MSERAGTTTVTGGVASGGWGSRTFIALVAVYAGLIGIVIAAPDRQPFADKHILAISPDYFECQWCESFNRHGQFLKRQYPGLTVSEIKVSQAEAKALGIEGFPTIIVGEKLVGYGTAERKRVQELLGQ